MPQLNKYKIRYFPPDTNTINIIEWYICIGVINILPYNMHTNVFFCFH